MTGSPRNTHQLCVERTRGQFFTRWLWRRIVSFQKSVL